MSRLLIRLNGSFYLKHWKKKIWSDVYSLDQNNVWKSSVRNNMSEFFTLRRGLRQGCPLSAVRFLLVAEVLANKTRTNQDICGIELDNHHNTNLRISMYADDTTLFLSDCNSIKKIANNCRKLWRNSRAKTGPSKDKRPYYRKFRSRPAPTWNNWLATRAV